MRKLLIGAVAVAVVATAAPAPAQAVDEVNTKKLRDAVTVNGILAHERVLQRIANENEGTRASGLPGYDASVDYAVNRLKRAGYQVRTQEFTFPFFRELAPSELEQVSPTPTTYESHTMDFSGGGEVTGKLVPIDLEIPPAPEPHSTSGCEASDFPPASASAPEVALVQRGTCFFEDKAANAEAAGYDAVVMMNEGQPGRQEVLTGTLGRQFDSPIVGTSFADGERLYNAAQAGTTIVRVFTEIESDPAATTTNVIADTKGGDKHKVLVVGAHLDSVAAGPGINDNGSGASAILEIAEEMAELKVQPRQKVRFALWGAEEAGLLGSEHYVANLRNWQLGRHWANLNFDMVGSPNYVRFVYDGDGSDSEPAGPPGSGQIEQVFTRYFAGQGLASAPTEFSGRSDYGPFIAVGIPAGGLFTGAEGIKTAEEAAVYGGTAGEAYDPCYHQACDTINNVNTKALFEMGDAAAHAVLTLAKTRSGFFEDGSRQAAPKAKSSKRGHEGHATR